MNQVTKYREISEIPGRLYAIGDIHGCLAETDRLLQYLEKDGRLAEDDIVVFIGDYVDRGPDSRGVIDRLLQFQLGHPNTFFLRGNHEDMMLSFLGFPGNMGHAFLLNGGVETLKSYEIPAGVNGEEAASLLPSAHLAFLLNLESYLIIGDFVLVHAGLSPIRDLRSQLDDDLFWIRDEFIHNKHRFEKLVVFGHTPYQDVMCNFPFKIGIDTGLVYGNKLSCIELVSKTVFQISKGSESIQEKVISDESRT